MSKKKQRANYSSDFRLNAVKKSLEPNTQVQDVADELGIPPAYLTRWRATYHANQQAIRAKEQVDAIAENSVLKEENKKLKMELDILKKAAVYFASQK